MPAFNLFAQNVYLQLFDLRSVLSAFWETYGGTVEFFSLVLSALFVWGIVYLMIRVKYIGYKIEHFVDFLGAADISRRRSVKAWQQIQKRLKIGGEANLKLAVIEADKILDELLKMSGYRGETMADRLKQVLPTQLSNIEDLWNCHKIRNRIVHEPDYRINQSETEIAVGFYKKAFQEFGLID